MSRPNRLWTPETSGLESFRMGMEASAVRPQGNDPVIKAIGIACVEELRQPYFRSLIEETLNPRAPIPPNHAAGLGRILVQWLKLYPDRRNQYEMTNDVDAFAPFHWRGCPRPKAVRKFLRQKLDYDSSERELAAHRLRYYNVGTTSRNRNTLPMIVLSAIGHQIPGYFGETINVADLGCSNNHGLKWLSVKDHLKENDLQPPQVKEKLSPKHRKDFSRFGINSEYTQGLNALWHTAPKLGVGLGVDTMDYLDLDISCWRRSSEYPKTYVRQPRNTAYAQIELHDTMDMMSPGNVKFHPGDITEISLDAIKPSLGEYKDEVGIFDSAWALTVLYELAPGQQAAALENMRRLARVVMVQDFGRVDPKDPSKFITSDKSLGESDYTLAVGNTEPGNLILHEWFISENGRVDNTRLGPGFGWFNGEQIFKAGDLARLGA